MTSKVAPSASPSVLADEATFERLVDEFDRNMKIVDFYVDTESFFDLELSLKNLKKVSIILSDSSAIVIHLKFIHFINLI
jgi:hypothetical protein